MSVKEIRNELFSIQERLHSLGATNNSRWATFCSSKIMTREEFSKKLSFYSLQIPIDHLDIIWNSIGLQGSVIDFPMFVKLMQIDSDLFEPQVNQQDKQPINKKFYDDDEEDNYQMKNISYNYSPEQTKQYSSYADEDYGQVPRGYGRPTAPSTAIHLVIENIIKDCMHIDGKKRGEITLNTFTDICEANGVNCVSEQWKKFVRTIDPEFTGLVSYFAIANDVCKENTLDGMPPNQFEVSSENHLPNYKSPPHSYRQPPESYSPSTPPRGSFSGRSPPMKNDYSPIKNDYSQDNDYLRKPDSPQGSGRFTDDRYTSKFNYQPQSSPRRDDLRRGYDDNLYQEPSYEPARMPSENYSYQRSSPSRPIETALGSRPQYSEYPGASRYQGVSDADLLKIISNEVNNIGSAKTAFDKWRGFEKVLTPSALRDRLGRDAKIDVPLSELERLAQKFGSGAWSRNGFTRMLSEANSENSSRRGIPARKMTQDDQALQDIADQISEEGWDQIIFKAATAHEICTRLRELHVICDEADMRRLTMKLGKTGVIDAIRQKLDEA